MKLQPALIFGEHMVLQRGGPIPVWGRSAGGDTVTVALGGASVQAKAEGGLWEALLPPMEAAEGLEMRISSQLTGESIVFQDVAVGEVWLAGGQSNMEFLLKYDSQAQEMYQAGPDRLLRFFRYPLACFTGCLEKDAFPDDGFWRQWGGEEDRGMFSAAAAYMGQMLREKLGVPVGFVGVNWGGTPAAAWTALEDLKANPALAGVLQWHRQGCAAVDLEKYYAASDLPQREPSPEEKARRERMMMGQGLDGPRTPPPPADYMPYAPGPRSAVRPGGLYESMLQKVAPYGVRGIVWYQGEDDDFRGWASFYDESMRTLIKSWRKLWGKELPFLQVELAPFRGQGPTAAKAYPTMRAMQRAAADTLPGVHNVCIMDAGDPINIHVRKKKPVGQRLALLARKYVYGETGLLADSPRCTGAGRDGDRVCIRFQDAGSGLVLKGDAGSVLQVLADGEPLSLAVFVTGSQMVLAAEGFRRAQGIHIEFAEMNYCQCPLFNSAGLPAFPFTIDL